MRIPSPGGPDVPELPAGTVRPNVDSMPYAQVGDLVAVRGFVRSCALALGLPATRVEMLALAVNELVTNTLQHTAGGGRVRVWAESGQLFCDVADGGRVPAFGPMPAADSPRGRGLAIVAMVADEVTALPEAGGTVVRIRMALAA